MRVLRSKLLLATQLVALLLGASASGSTTGGEWAHTFVAERLAPYALRIGARVLVAPSGAEPTDQAAHALREGLRATRRTKLVMDSGALGALDTLDDQEIVRRAAALPVDTVAVLRVFPGSDGGQRAVVTVYDKAGKVMAGFNAERGVAMPELPGVGTGVSSEASSSVSRVLRDEQRPGSPANEAQRAYDEQFVGFNDVSGINGNGFVVGQWNLPYVGKYRRPIEGPVEFLRAVSRPDLAAHYEHQSGVRTALLLPGWLLIGMSGMVVIGAGSLTLVSASHTGATWEEVTACGLGGGALAAGFFLAIAGASIERLVLTPHKKRELADQHNRKLRERLGLPPQDDPVSSRPQLRFSVTPTVGPQGGRLVVQVAF